MAFYSFSSPHAAAMMGNVVVWDFVNKKIIVFLVCYLWKQPEEKTMTTQLMQMLANCMLK